MVEVYKTNIQDKDSADKIVIELLEAISGFRINIDLDDCDKILRVEGDKFCHDAITKFLQQKGFSCEILE
jgi:hypothetical protein